MSKLGWYKGLKVVLTSSYEDGFFRDFIGHTVTIDSVSHEGNSTYLTIVEFSEVEHYHLVNARWFRVAVV